MMTYRHLQNKKKIIKEIVLVEKPPMIKSYIFLKNKIIKYNKAATCGRRLTTHTGELLSHAS
jgi:hypothetical protein